MQFIRAAVLAILAQCLGLSAAVAAPEGYDRILQTSEEFEIGGHKLQVPIEVWLKTRFAEDAAYFDLWADADLSSFQDEAMKIAAGMSRYRKCGDRIRVQDVNLVPLEDRAQLCLHVRYEKWQCLQAAIPWFNGIKLSLKKGPAARTRTIAQNGHVCAEIWPVVSEDGHEVNLDTKLTKNAVSGQSGFLGDLFNVRGKFRTRLRQEVNGALSKLKLPVPEALQSFGPVLNEAKFTTREDGALGLVMVMNVKVSPSELPQILAVLTNK